MLSYLIDPYLLYNSTRITGFNDIKPAAGRHSVQSKIHLAHKRDIDVLIIGNSRPEMGINPDHVYFQKNNLKAYNLGQPGSSLSTQYGYALDIIREKNIKYALIAVDFIDFVTSGEDFSDPYREQPQRQLTDKRRKFNWDGSVNEDYSFAYFKDIYLPLVSLDSLKDSLFTLLGQKKNSSNLLSNGFNPARDMNFTTRNEGVKTLFNQKIPQLISQFSSRDWKTYTPGYRWSPAFNKFQFLLNYLKEHQIETKVFINPYHRQYLEIIEDAGLTQEFSLWKRELVNIVADTSTNKKIILWNFSDPDDHINENPLTAGRTPLKWFWEPAHYRKELGDIMINNMLASPVPAEKGERLFGYILTPENIDFHLNDYATKFKAYSP